MILSAHQVNKQYMRKRDDANVFYAVEDTDFTLNPGELVVFTGHSGSGKTTLLNMLGGLLAPSAGQVLLDGTDIYALDDKKRSVLRNDHFGLIPQGQTALQALTVMENVLLPYTLYGTKEKKEGFAAARTYAGELLEQTGIAALEHVMPSELSGGEMRRMAICRALIRRPEIVLGDEPTEDLDEQNTQKVLELLKDQAKQGKAVLVVTHDRDVFPYADRIFQMRDGVLSEYFVS